VLIELFLPGSEFQVVEDCRDADDDWRLPSLWIAEFRHVHLKFLRAGLIDLSTALNHLAVAERKFLPRTIAVDSAAALQLAHHHGCSSYDAEFVVLAQQLACPLVTFDRKLLQLFPDMAIRPGSSLRCWQQHKQADHIHRQARLTAEAHVQCAAGAHRRLAQMKLAGGQGIWRETASSGPVTCDALPHPPLPGGGRALHGGRRHRPTADGVP
jgi:predicted nucleic acid-binding protein